MGVWPLEQAQPLVTLPLSRRAVVSLFLVRLKLSLTIL